MAAEQSANLTAEYATPAYTIHPLAPLTSGEILQSRDLIQSLYSASTALLFKQITLQEPRKEELVPYFDGEHRGVQAQGIDRRAFINYYIRNTVRYIVH